MADASANLMVEEWVRGEWMFERYGQLFSSARVSLSSGGFFNFDAVSADGRIVGNISTSGSKMANGKLGGGKMNKVRSDIYFLLLAKTERKVMVLTEQDMHERWLKEVEKGRVPRSIEFLRVDLPAELNLKLQAAKVKAALEVTPR